MTKKIKSNPNSINRLIRQFAATFSKRIMRLGAY